MSEIVLTSKYSHIIRHSTTKDLCTTCGQFNNQDINLYSSIVYTMHNRVRKAGSIMECIGVQFAQYTNGKLFVHNNFLFQPACNPF